jgi:hypothetical protein
VALKIFNAQQFTTGSDDGAIVRQLNGLVSALRNFFRQLEANIALDYVDLKSVALATLTTTVVNHKLGRVLQGWTITAINGPSTIYETARTTTNITFYSSGTVSVDLRVW